MNTSDLVELLQKSAVEHLTTYRQLQVREFGSVTTVVTTDFEALYVYKRGDYQQCLQLCTHNVRKLLCATSVPHIPLFPEFIQLLDDDIVSLTALMMICNPKCRLNFDKAHNSEYSGGYMSISQLILSLYLMTQCHLKLRHSVMSLAPTLGYIAYIKLAHRRSSEEAVPWRVILKMIEHKVLTYIENNDE